MRQHDVMLKVRCFTLPLIALASVMFSRLLVCVGVPSVVNFLHFSIVLSAALLVFWQVRFCASAKMVIVLVVILGCIVVSAIVNHAGIINVVLDFLLLTEPLLFLYLITSTRWSNKSVEMFRFCLICIAAIHVAIAYFQWGVMGFVDDNVTGLFVGLGAASHVAGAVALSAAIYFLAEPRPKTFTFKFLQVGIFSSVVILADAKQVIAVFLAAAIALSLVNARRFWDGFRLFVLAIVASVIVFIIANTVFPELLIWVEKDRLITGITQKISVFEIIAANFTSLLNWFFGLGPGHTVDRLGFLLPKYFGKLDLLGATISPVTAMVWDAQQGNYTSNTTTGSSMFSLFFSWVGVWGDLGFVGLSIYAYSWIFVWRNFTSDNHSRFLLLTVCIFGGVYSWMEEPGYMLFVMSLIGLIWQEKGLASKAKIT